MSVFAAWNRLYDILIDSPVFQRVKGVAEGNVLVSTRFYLLIFALTNGRIEGALASGVHDLAAGLASVGQPLTEAEKAFWNNALTDCRFEPDSPARLEI